ncbi:hypothetical protein GRI42_13825 [Erythrobacter gaetbuli]|uniref:Uncharacterized protein n=1 Tax=Qipengyuania gaetbuli TaxID=266952 RepID=A0A844Y2F4_9SPHN|nr:hypothetical protein [Qipengyuania gaetbuli]MXO52385.1 hypothetical protein [Qipengyuania gaetbuli]
MNNERGNVGLGGDGDEITALYDVEEAFGVELDYSSADEWTTVGDVWKALLKQLPDGAAERPETWSHFKEALCRETGMDPKRIDLKSGLIVEDGHWVPVGHWTELLWILAIGVAAVVWWMS